MPQDVVTLRWQRLLNLTCKEILNVWRYADDGPEVHGDFLDYGYLENNTKSGEFGPETKGGIRPAAQNAYTIAVAIFTGAYEDSITGIPIGEALDFSLSIVKSLAHDHLSNGGIGHPWGHQWQSAQWASKTAVAGWLLWDHLSLSDRTFVANMIVSEADRFIDLRAPAANGNYKMNTHAEENGWDATGIQTACAMLLRHPNRNLWMDKLYEYRLTALATPADSLNSNILRGRKVSEWITGYNIDSLGGLGNHKAYPHPDYMAAPLRHAFEGALFFKLADLDIPEVNSFNYHLIYNNFCNYNWNDSSTIFRKDGTIYWPIDIESDRRFEFITFGITDLGAQILGYDQEGENTGAYYEEKHTEKALEMQLTGFTAASAYLWRWLNFQEN